LNPVARSWREALHRSGPSNMRPIRRHKVSRNATASGSNKRVIRFPCEQAEGKHFGQVCSAS
jgi:hypothetical protein